MGELPIGEKFSGMVGKNLWIKWKAEDRSLKSEVEIWKSEK
jgi:hypothetical protein